MEGMTARREVPFGFYMLDVSLPTLHKRRASSAAEFAQRAARAAEALAIFRRFDLDGDGILNREEMKAAAAAVCPGEAWDSALWDGFCIEYEADPTFGFDPEAFERFRADMAATHPTGAVIADLPQLDWPDDWPATEVRLATTVFVEHDVDADSHLNLGEMRCLVESEHPAETWDDDEWEVMCEHLGVSPDTGLSFEAFLRFRLSVIEAEAEQVWEDVVASTDTDHVEFMSKVQLRQWAEGAAKRLQSSANDGVGCWDEALWAKLCESYAADPSRGFTWEQFLLLFRTRQALVEAQEQLSAAQITAARVKAQDERNVFLRYDVDGDGYLNLDEMGLAALQVFHCCSQRFVYNVAITGASGSETEESYKCCLSFVQLFIAVRGLWVVCAFAWTALPQRCVGRQPMGRVQGAVRSGPNSAWPEPGPILKFSAGHGCARATAARCIRRV